MHWSGPSWTFCELQLLHRLQSDLLEPVRVDAQRAHAAAHAGAEVQLRPNDGHVRRGCAGRVYYAGGV